jgi:hypothetical protein
MHQLSDLYNDGTSKIERVAKQPAETKFGRIKDQKKLYKGNCFFP